MTRSKNKITKIFRINLTFSNDFLCSYKSFENAIDMWTFPGEISAYTTNPIFLPHSTYIGDISYQRFMFTRPTTSLPYRESVIPKNARNIPRQKNCEKISTPRRYHFHFPQISCRPNNISLATYFSKYLSPDYPERLNFLLKSRIASRCSDPVASGRMTCAQSSV